MWQRHEAARSPGAKKSGVLLHGAKKAEYHCAAAGRGRGMREVVPARAEANGPLTSASSKPWMHRWRSVLASCSVSLSVERFSVDASFSWPCERGEGWWKGHPRGASKCSTPPPTLRSHLEGRDVVGAELRQAARHHLALGFLGRGHATIGGHGDVFL